MKILGWDITCNFFEAAGFYWKFEEQKIYLPIWTIYTFSFFFRTWSNDWHSVAKSWTAKIPPLLSKIPDFCPPLTAENPTIFGQKIPHFEVFFLKLDPSYNFYCIFMHKFFSNFKKFVIFFFKLNWQKKIFLNITERKILSEN